MRPKWSERGGTAGRESTPEPEVPGSGVLMASDVPCGNMGSADVPVVADVMIVVVAVGMTASWYTTG